MTSSGTEHKGEFGSVADRVRQVLRRVWDPIDVAEAPSDEYDSYVPRFVAMVQSTADRRHIRDALLKIEFEEMGISGPLARADRASLALLALREAFSFTSETLIEQIINDDGAQVVWFFCRPDSLFSYEHAASRVETDVNGECTWFTSAGEGRSGLFATFADALGDARSKIDWLRQSEAR